MGGLRAPARTGPWGIPGLGPCLVSVPLCSAGASRSSLRQRRVSARHLSGRGGTQALVSCTPSQPASRPESPHLSSEPGSKILELGGSEEVREHPDVQGPRQT